VVADGGGSRARSRLLAAADEEPTGPASARERQRGERALASLARLRLDPGVLAEARERLARFAREESPTKPTVIGSGRSAGGGTPARRPRRRHPVPLDAQRHLLPGWDALSREARERWRAREEGIADGPLLADLAWFACDGLRTVDEIAHLVWLETGRHEPEFIDRFFDLTATLDLSTDVEEAACSPSAPDTATR